MEGALREADEAHGFMKGKKLSFRLFRVIISRHVGSHAFLENRMRRRSGPLTICPVLPMSLALGHAAVLHSESGRRCFGF